MEWKSEWRTLEIDGAVATVEAGRLREAQWRKEVGVMVGCARIDERALGGQRTANYK